MTVFVKYVNGLVCVNYSRYYECDGKGRHNPGKGFSRVVLTQTYSIQVFLRIWRYTEPPLTVTMSKWCSNILLILLSLAKLPGLDLKSLPRLPSCSIGQVGTAVQGKQPPFSMHADSIIHRHVRFRQSDFCLSDSKSAACMHRCTLDAIASALAILTACATF